MTKTQFDNAVVMAQEGSYADVDDSILHGCALPDFKPVTITLDVAAKFIAWHCINLDGTINCEELTEMRAISRKRWLVCC